MHINKTTWFLLVRKINLIKGLEELKIHEKETCTFEVELSHEEVEVTWLKDNVRLKSGPNCKITTLGKKHALTLSALRIEDSGLISFKAEGIHTSGRLNVTGKFIFKLQVLSSY